MLRDSNTEATFSLRHRCAVFFVSAIVLFAPALFLFLTTFAWDPRLRILHRYTSWWGAHYLVHAPLVPE